MAALSKCFKPLMPCLLLLATPTLYAMQGNECSKQAEKLAQEKRKAFISSCLEKASSTSNVKAESLQQRKRRCEQNSRNQQLTGTAKTRYLSACVEKNEAANAARRKPNNTIPVSSIPLLNEVTPKNKNQQKQKEPQREKTHDIQFNLE